MIYKNLPNIIRNSQNIFYKFWLDSSNNLIVENYDEFNVKNNIRFTYRQSVLDYSVDIDETDRIHIAFITNDGILKYSILDSPTVEKTISSVSSKDYKINYLTIKNISSDVHIFYMIQSKYNIDKWTIHHSFLHNNIWNSNKLGETLSTNSPLPYSIDSYKNNIYIFYLTNTPNQYCIQKFNISFSIWSTIDKSISLLNCQNAELFINNLGIGVICYNSLIGRNTNTLLKFKDFNANSSIWSDGLLVKSNTFDSSLPSILCKNDALFLFWRENDTLFLVKSFYEATGLVEKKVLQYKDIISNCKYITTEISYYGNKNNFLFFINMTPPYTILEDSDVQSFLKVDSVKTEQKYNPLNGPLRETLKIIAENSNLNNKPLYNSEESSTAEYINNINLDTFATTHYPLDNNFKNKLDERNKNVHEFELDKLINQPKEFMRLKPPQIDHLKAKLSFKENEVEQLLNSFSLKQNEIEQFKNNLSLKETELEQLNNNLNSKETEIKQLINILSSKETDIEQLKNTFNSKEAEIEQLKNTLALKEAEIEQLKITLNLKDAEIQSLNASYSSFKSLADEKDLLIQNLYYKIQELELQNENTQSSQIQKKKSFIDLFKI